MKILIVAFFGILNFSSAESASDLNFKKSIWSPDRMIKAVICEVDGKSGIRFSSKKINIFESSIAPSRPLIWSGDSSGVFIIEHIAHGNYIYFLKIENGRLIKHSIDPDLDNIRSFKISKVSILKNITKISFIVTLHGKKLVDRYNVVYNLSYNHKSNSIQDYKIVGISEEEVAKLPKLINLD
jgi:hypothetical protein